MGKLIDLTGQRFGMLTVVGRAENQGKAVCWHCLCDCGKSINATTSNLRRGYIKSCGCQKAETLQQMRKTHGLSKTRLYSVWRAMKTRCYVNSDSSFPFYGGRGISVCEDWLNSFQSFYLWSISHGYVEGLSIDRIDDNGDYCPENCRWSTSQEQANNTRRNYNITYKSNTKTLAEWSRITGLGYHTIQDRLNAGWSIERALTEPVHKPSGNKK